jgi:hypothetical protein
MAGARGIRLLDSQAWHATGGAPLQFARWLAALATVIADWIQSGAPQNAVSYVPVLAVVALLLLPDARSIAFAGVRFERLTDEVAQQKQAVDTLCAEVSSINNSLIAGSQVNITLAGTGPAAADRTPGPAPIRPPRP